MKSCKDGYYYCNTDEKCKPIPEGSMVQPDGLLVKKDVSEEKEKTDHEVSMAHKQLSKTERNIAKLKKALGKKEKDIPAWVQGKITTSTDKLDSASSYMQDSVSIEDANGKPLLNIFRGQPFLSSYMRFRELVYYTKLKCYSF